MGRRRQVSPAETRAVFGDKREDGIRIRICYDLLAPRDLLLTWSLDLRETLEVLSAFPVAAATATAVEHPDGTTLVEPASTSLALLRRRVNGTTMTAARALQAPEDVASRG